LAVPRPRDVRRGHAFAQPHLGVAKSEGDAGDCVCQDSSFPSSGWMFAARPRGGLRHFWGSGFGRLLTTHRESVRWSISLHYRIASLQGRIAVKCGEPGDVGPSRRVCWRLHAARSNTLPALPRGCIFGCNCYHPFRYRNAYLSRPDDVRSASVRHPDRVRSASAQHPLNIPIASGWRSFGVLIASG
jgi:hypothetical protein